MNSIFNSLLPSLILLVLILAPLGVVVGIVTYTNRQEKRATKRSPLNEKILHQAGFQASKKIDEINDGIMERLMQVMLIGPLAMLVILLPRVRWSHIHFGWVDYFVGAIAIGLLTLLTSSVVRMRKERKAWHAGYLGELATAQALNKLVEQGCTVFHDLPTDRANIDHIVVGPTAVFVVETKWRSKGQGKAGSEVRYDGKKLQFPGQKTDKPLEQVRGLAQWLAKYLHGETGSPVRIVPTVALPGWYVVLEPGASTSDVKVINEKWQKTFLEMGGSEISRDQRTRIANAISKRYPDMTLIDRGPG